MQERAMGHMRGHMGGHVGGRVRREGGRRRRRAFTLVELLMVMLIIAIVVAIVVPALGGARNAARAAATQRVLTDFVQAVNRFTNDRQGVLPGFYSARELGLSGNEAYGFTAMENALAELAGGLVVPEGGGLGIGGQAGQELLEIEIPGTDRTMYVNPDLIGSGDYFSPDKALLVGQIAPSQVGSDDHVGQGPDDRQMPDLVDAWGNPLLLWVEDEFGPSKIEEATDFARGNSGSGGEANAARFYWACNAGFLNSTQLGQSAKDQTQALTGSVIGGDGSGAAPAGVSESLMGILGNPSFPDNRRQVATDIVATAPRGSFVAHSAGADGVYFSRRDKGAKAVGAGTPGEALIYGLNFKTAKGSQEDLLNDEGQVDTRDLVKMFDDMIQSGGN